MINFTIITCTYNASKYIDRTLDSVRGQSYPHIEHFIIDGASKDDTVKKVQTYAYDSRYPVIVKSEPDNGLYDAMNKGILISFSLMPVMCFTKKTPLPALLRS